MLICLRFWDQEAARVGGLVCGMVLIAHGQEAWRYALYRTLETIVGILAAVGISLVPKLLGAEDAGGQAG